MLRIHAPFAARTHPLLTGLILTARRLQKRHTVVFEDPLNAPVRRGAGSTLKDFSASISLSIEGGPRLVSPSILSAVLTISRSSGAGQAGAPAISDDVLESLCLWESRVNAVADSFDELALAIAIQHYTGVMAANDALCAAMELLDSQLARACNGDEKGLASNSMSPSPSSSVALSSSKDSIALPLLPVLEFLTGDARMPLSPYAHVSSFWSEPNEDLKRTRALIRATAASYSQQVIGKSVVGDTNFTNTLPSSYAFIQKIQTGDKTDLMRKKMPTLEDIAARSHGGFGASAAVPQGKSKLPPRVRRDL